MMLRGLYLNVQSDEKGVGSAMLTGAVRYFFYLFLVEAGK